MYDFGLVSRFTPADEDDLYQTGMMAAIQSINRSEKRTPIFKSWYWQTLMRDVKSAMNRGGTDETRIVGDMHIAEINGTTKANVTQIIKRNILISKSSLLHNNNDT